MADYISLGLTLDTEAAKKSLDSLDTKTKGVTASFVDLGSKSTTEIDRMTSALKHANAEMDLAEKRAKKFGEFIGKIGSVATGAFGMVTAVLKFPMDFDNYLGQLGQKVTTVGGQLERFGNAYKNMLGSFKQSEGGFGLAPEELKRIEYQFSAGATGAEKYGATMEASQRNYQNAAGNMKWLLGFDPAQGMALLTDLRKTIGLTAEAADPFVKSMAVIGRNANMTDKQFYGLTKQVSGLSKAYGMTSEQAKVFVKDSLAVGAAVSHLGMDAQSTIAKMNEVASGSEQGLISSLLLGFKPGDAKGQLAAFQAQAKQITAIADSAGPQFAPYLIESIKGPMGMGQFGIEDIRRFSGGLDVEGKKQDATDLLKDILTLMTDEKELAAPAYVSMERLGGNLEQAVEKGMLAAFGGKGVMADLKKLLGETLPHMIESFTKFVITAEKFIGGLSLGKLTAAAVALKAAPHVIGWGIKKAAGALLGNIAKQGVTKGLLTSAQAASGLAVPIGVGVAGGLAGKKWAETKTEAVGEEASADVANLNAIDREKRLATYKAALASGDPDKIARARNFLQGVSPVSPDNDSSGMKRLENFVRENSLHVTDVNTPGVHKPNSLHYQNEALDIRTRDMKPAEISALMARATKAGLHYVDETKTSSPHLHLTSRPEPSSMAGRTGGAAAKIASAAPRPAGDMNKVHDEGANVTLSDIRNILAQMLNGGAGQPALAGSPTGYQNPGHEHLVQRLFGGG